MASSRLPGKAVLPLDGIPVIQHDIRRALAASVISDVVVATTFHECDDIVAEYARDAGAVVYRGSEDDVLGRLTDAAIETGDEAIVRLTGDNPLVAPDLIDTVGRAVLSNDIDYASNKLDRTFPIGVDAEAVTTESLSRVESIATHPSYREHALKYYRNNPSEFQVRNVAANEIYGDDGLKPGPDLRLTIDEFDDYRLFQRIYDRIDYDNVVDVRKAIQLVTYENLDRVNEHVDQQTF
jgi:spore coat polysaccharide biosynthesis protein SpsF